MAQPPTIEQSTPQRLAIEDFVLVEAPIEQVYQQWSDVTRFPDHMRNVISVTPIGERHYHWITSFFGQRQEWDTDITADDERRAIAWRSLAGDEHNGGLTFTPQDDNSTEVRLRMEITPPTGLAPQRFDRLAQTARKRTHSDLRRFSRRMAAPRPSREEAPTGTIGMLTQLGVATTAAGLGGYAAYMVGQRLRGSASYRAMRSQVIPSASVTSWLLAGASAASVVGAATYR
ncbi:MAG: SRPBCC family protein, partial [Ktedonobacterales bacterium]